MSVKIKQSTTKKERSECVCIHFSLLFIVDVIGYLTEIPVLTVLWHCMLKYNPLSLKLFLSEYFITAKEIKQGQKLIL